MCSTLCQPVQSADNLFKCLLVQSADKIFKLFLPRSGPTKRKTDAYNRVAYQPARPLSVPVFVSLVNLCFVQSKMVHLVHLNTWKKVREHPLFFRYIFTWFEITAKPLSKPENHFTYMKYGST